jgi:molecular chaperone DnaJ
MAALGGKIKVPLLDDVMEYTIPEGTQSGKIFFVRGKGIKTGRGTGDLYIVVKVETPSKLTREQKKALENLASSFDVKQTTDMKKFKDNMDAMYGVDPYNAKKK